MGFLEELYNVFMNVSEKVEQGCNRQATRAFRESTIKYDDEDPESVKRYTETKEKFEEFQKQKFNFDQQKAALKYRHDSENAKKKGDIYGQERAAFEYNKSIEHANLEQRKIKNMIYESDVRIQKKMKFYHETLPKIVVGIELTKSAISKSSTDKNTNTKENDYFEQLLSLYYERVRNQDIEYFENVKKQEDIIRKVQNGKIELFSNQTKGNFGEMLVDSDLRKKGYVRISLETVTSLNNKNHQGIDGIYYNPNVIPNVIIIEAKYNTSQISTLKSGCKETSSEWLNDVENQTKPDRIKQSLGNMSGEYSDDLAMEIYESQLAEDENVVVVTARISEDNKTIKYIKMDDKGEYVDEFRYEDD